MNDNGRAGAAALNLAGVRESLIQNNLAYANFASGIVEWDNNNGFDRGLVEPGPKSPGEVTGAESLPLFGCFQQHHPQQHHPRRGPRAPRAPRRQRSWGRGRATTSS